MNHPVKRHEDFLEAIAQLRRVRPDVQAILVGDGPRSMHLQGRAMELGLTDVAHFLSYRIDVPAIYARASVAVNCSLAEGLSNAVIEAMAARVPTVVTSVGGNPELIAHGERGLVVPPQRPDLLANAILELLQQRDRARELGRRARTFVERHLNLTRMGRAHDALYRRTLGIS
jgi:glycosyltransferase involved in cell wall biosynthesis